MLASVTQRGITSLHFACGKGSLSVAKKLVELDPNLLRKTDEEKGSALYFTAVSGNEQLVEWLAEEDPFLLATVDQNGSTPLHEACWQGNLVVAQKLIELHPAFLQKKRMKNGVYYILLYCRVTYNWLIGWLKKTRFPGLVRRNEE